MKKEPQEKTAEEKELSRFSRAAFVEQRTEELTYLYSWLERIHPEQLRGQDGKQIGLGDYVARNIDGWAVRP
jgi:hypothetical protein